MNGRQPQKQGKTAQGLEFPLLLFVPLYLGGQNCPIKLAISGSAVLDWPTPHGSHLAGNSPAPALGPQGLPHKLLYSSIEVEKQIRVGGPT